MYSLQEVHHAEQLAIGPHSIMSHHLGLKEARIGEASFISLYGLILVHIITI